VAEGQRAVCLHREHARQVLEEVDRSWLDATSTGSSVVDHFLRRLLSKLFNSWRADLSAVRSGMHKENDVVTSAGPRAPRLPASTVT